MRPPSSFEAPGEAMESSMAVTPTLEVWGGLECTVNRVGDRYFDQFELTGHLRRPEDLNRVAVLGIKTLRYPVLWERTCPGAPHHYDWSFADQRLERIRALGMRPIVGLLHHGSGPRHISLVDAAFPRLFAGYASQVARRYPWVEDYTPVNEPLTTARFSGLYGHWFPHGRDDRTFVQALLLQCRGIVLAMRAIRAVNSRARLIQTEDLGKIFSTPPLAYQADFENERRWISLDLLCGRVDERHPLRDFLTRSGATPEDFDFFLANPCPPDIFGFNYYVTSERFLDHRLELHPARAPGGNGRDAYVDIEAVRACEPAGVGRLLLEAWERYRAPMALTEVQLSGERENQVGWLREVWKQTLAAKRLGADIRALTAWSLFGACEWNSMVTEIQGYYEPGAFDSRGPQPRPTALARLVAGLATGQDAAAAPSLTEGWWRRTSRLLLHPPFPVAHPPFDASGPSPKIKPILITGATGTLGKAFQAACMGRELPFHVVSRAQMDIADPASVRAMLAAIRPWALINAAGFVRVDDAESDPGRCRRENTLGPSVLAEACAEQGVRFLTFSSDLVFDGGKQKPYLESDRATPLNVYGHSKAEAEAAVLARLPTALIVRTSAFFGAADPYNFVARTYGALRRNESVTASDRHTVSPTHISDLVNTCLDFLQDGEAGLWHLANRGAATWFELARETARIAKLNPDLISQEGHDGRDRAPRPRYSVLGSERGWPLPSLEQALRRCISSLLSCSSQPAAAG